VAARAKRGKTRDARSSAGPRKDRKVVGRRRRSCFFCREKVAAVDYKNIAQLRRFIPSGARLRAAATQTPAGNTRSRWRFRSNARVR
jgi:ribosomal protein S18